MWLARSADGHRRRLPQFPLRKGQRLKPGLSALQPLLKKRAFVFGHGLLQRTASSCGSPASDSPPARPPSKRSMSSSERASRSTSSVARSFRRRRHRPRERGRRPLRAHVPGDQARRSGRWCVPACRLVGAAPRRWRLRCEFSISTPISESSPRSVSGWSSRRVSGLTRRTEPTTSRTACGDDRLRVPPARRIRS